MVLNFNYTNTPYLYSKKSDPLQIMDIHGQIGDKDDDICIGYGNEQDKRLEELKNRDDYETLRFIKSIYYPEKNRRRRLGLFLEATRFQVDIIGHSCGLSDGVLLNFIFEHPYCIQIIYHYHEDIQDHKNKMMNIYRHFNDPQLFQKRVIDFETSEKCPQWK